MTQYCGRICSNLEWLLTFSVLKHEREIETPYNSDDEQTILTLAVELDSPCVTFLRSPLTLPSLISPDIPSVTSLNKPNGLPRKSTDPRILAA